MLLSPAYMPLFLDAAAYRRLAVVFWPPTQVLHALLDMEAVGAIQGHSGRHPYIVWGVCGVTAAITALCLSLVWCLRKDGGLSNCDVCGALMFVNFSELECPKCHRKYKQAEIAMRERLIQGGRR